MLFDRSFILTGRYDMAIDREARNDLRETLVS